MDSSVNSEKNEQLDTVVTADTDTAASSPDTPDEITAAPDAVEDEPQKPASAPMPDMPVISPAPHIRTPNTTRSVMLDVLIALLPAFIWGVFHFGLRTLMIGIVSVASCVLFEALTQLVLRRPVTISDLSAAVTGLLLAMNLSSAVPIWMPVVGAFFAIVVVKQLFGGIGKNVVNPALAARVFLFAWPGQMGTFTAAGVKLTSMGTADVVSSATPLAALKAGDLPANNVLDMFVGKMPGCIGEVSALFLLLGGVYLLLRRVITWHIPVSYIATVAALTFIFPQSPGGNLDFMLAELLSGGLILGAVFMATDYATSPITTTGRVIFGIGCGLITVFIRYFGGYPEGVSFSILIMNLLVWYIDRFTMPVKFGGKSNEKKK